jgi:hypothetical protein
VGNELIVTSGYSFINFTPGFAADTWEATIG